MKLLKIIAKALFFWLGKDDTPKADRMSAVEYFELNKEANEIRENIRNNKGGYYRLAAIEKRLKEIDKAIPRTIQNSRSGNYRGNLNI